MSKTARLTLPGEYLFIIPGIILLSRPGTDLDRSSFCRHYSDAGWKDRAEKECCSGRTGIIVRNDNCRLYPADRYSQRPGCESNSHAGTGNYADADNHASAVVDANADTGTDTSTNTNTGTDTVTISDAGPLDYTYPHSFAFSFPNALTHALTGACIPE